MTFTDILKGAANVAPVLLSALGPGGTAAGIAIKALSSAFGTKEEEMTPEALEQILASDKDALLKLKQAEMDYQLKLNDQKLQENEQKLKETQQRLADVQNARQMNVDTTKATGKRDTNLYALAWVIVVGFFVLIGILIFHDLPKDSNGVVFMLFGALAAGFSGIKDYFFGSSAGSAAKTALLAKAEPIKE
jgi:hypothetical protein